MSDRQGVPHDSTTNYFPSRASINPDHIQPGDTLKRIPLDRLADCHRAFESDSEYLFAFKVPVLSNYFLGHFIYRFLWLRSFDRPVLLTLHRTQSGSVLYTQFLSKGPRTPVPGMINPDEPGISSKERARRIKFGMKMLGDREYLAAVAFAKAPVVRTSGKSVVLNQSQLNQFDTLFAASDFWQTSSCKIEGILDGAEWILEAHEPTRYHVVSRNTPDESMKWRQCCEFLLNLSPAKSEERY